MKIKGWSFLEKKDFVNTEIFLRRINAGVSIGAIAAFLVCLMVSGVFLPSAVSTILKYRCGVLPTLRSKEFLQYRFAGMF